jgi:hypothetical protein
VRWSIGGSRAATGNGDADEATPGHSAEAAQIQELLSELSRVRLAVSADLSAAAGALDDDRPDVASDMMAGARRELRELLDPARPSRLIPTPSTQLVSAGAETADDKQATPRGSGGGPRRHVARALAGAAALAVAIAVLPQIAGGNSSHRAPGAAAAARPSPAMRLASSEFTMFSKQLIAADASPATILAAGRAWQSAVTRDLPSAASQASSAADLVTMLRAERTLLQVSPTLRAPRNHAVAASLATESDSLLARLRQLASPQVLAILPAAIQALPISAPSKPTSPVAGATPATAAVTPPSGTTGGEVPTAPTTGATNPTAPQVSSGPVPAPTLDPGLLVPQLPLPSTLGQLTGGGTQDGGLGQTVGDVLSGLGLGG